MGLAPQQVGVRSPALRGSRGPTHRTAGGKSWPARLLAPQLASPRALNSTVLPAQGSLE